MLSEEIYTGLERRKHSHSAADVHDLAAALSEIALVLGSAQYHQAVLNQAGFSLDRALIPVLLRIHEVGPQGVSELARHLFCNHSVVSRQVSRLASMGLVMRKRSAKGITSSNVCLTSQGRTLVERYIGAREKIIANLVMNWHTGDRGKFAASSRRLAKALLTLQSAKG